MKTPAGTLSAFVIWCMEFLDVIFWLYTPCNIGGIKQHF
jgi:hypothetical protein